MRVNPEVLRGQGLGDSFEWNRADSSCFRRAGVGGLLESLYLLPLSPQQPRVEKSLGYPPSGKRGERKRYLGRVVLQNCYKNQEFELRRIFAKFSKLKPEIL